MKDAHTNNIEREQYYSMDPSHQHSAHFHILSLAVQLANQQL